MTGLIQSLLKLIAAGLLCGGILSLGGKGPLREILRFGCACLTVAVLLTVLRQGNLPTELLSGYKGQLQARVDQAQQENRQAILSQVRQSLTETLEQQAAVYSIDCSMDVQCSADHYGNVTVDGVEVRYRSGPRERLRELRQNISGQLLLPMESIIVKEEENP